MSVMHLNAEQLVDIAEGTRPEASAPHLAGCEPCRAQLRDLRAMLAAAKDVDVPEPSPLFWDHLSSRVHEAVEVDGSLPRRSWFLTPSRCVPFLAVAAVLLLAVVFKTPGPRVSVPAQSAAGVEWLSDAPLENDPSLSMMASLAAGLDADAAHEAGLSEVGSADHAITHMNGAELRELRRLMKDEL